MTPQSIAYPYNKRNNKEKNGKLPVGKKLIVIVLMVARLVWRLIFQNLVITTGMIIRRNKTVMIEKKSFVPKI